MRDALLLELHKEAQEVDEYGKAIKRLRLVARALVEAALQGDVSAIKEINDRVDGKVPQTIAGDPDNPLVIGTVIHQIVRPEPKPLQIVDAGDDRAA
jgi:hypothetical protein